MKTLGVITWNMRGGTVGGDKTKKQELLMELNSYCYNKYDLKSPVVFMLQETGTMDLSKETWWNFNYQMEYSMPIAAKNNRCTTALFIPLAYTISKGYKTSSQDSGTRSYITAGIDINGKTILLGSIHAVASAFAAQDDRAYLASCSEYEYFVCGGDYNCAPAAMDSWNQFTKRQQEQGHFYNVETTNDTTHRTQSTGDERILDYVCVKNLKTGAKERLFNSLDIAEAAYSDHWPVFYEIHID